MNVNVVCMMAAHKGDAKSSGDGLVNIVELPAAAVAQLNVSDATVRVTRLRTIGIHCSALSLVEARVGIPWACAHLRPIVSCSVAKASTKARAVLEASLQAMRKLSFLLGDSPPPESGHEFGRSLYHPPSRRQG